MRFVLGLVLVVGVSALADDAKKGAGKDLEKAFKDAAAATGDERAKLAKAFLLDEPAKWFEKSFGKEKGAALAKAYESETRSFEKRLGAIWKEMRVLTEVEGLRLEKGAKEANGPQKAAFDAMKEAFALYTVHLKAEAEAKPVLSVWSFAFVGGSFRFVGSLRALVKEAPDSKDDEDPLAAPIDCRVAKVNQGTVLLSVGTDDEVDKGFEFWVYRGSDLIGKVVVTSVEKDSCEGKAVRTAKGQKIEAGDACSARFPF